MAKYNKSNLPVSGATASEGPVVTKQVPPHFKGTVMARCIKQDFGPSKSSGKPQITLTYEILIPERVLSEYDGRTYDMSSLTPKVYLSVGVENLAELVNDTLPRLGLPAEIDDENPLKSESNPEGILFEGQIHEIYVSARERKETRKKSDGTYEDVVDSRGNPITRGWEFNMISQRDLLGVGNLAAASVAENRPV